MLKKLGIKKAGAFLTDVAVFTIGMYGRDFFGEMQRLLASCNTTVFTLLCGILFITFIGYIRRRL